MIQRTVSALSLASLVWLAGCATPPPAPVSVTATVASQADYSTLNQLLSSSGLGATLSSGGPYTLFAPNNQAFAAVPAKTMSELAGNPEMLKSVLGYHVLAGSVMAAQVQPGKVKTLQGAELTLAKAGDFVTVEEAVVVQADQKATNGVIHGIDRVLLPPKR